MPEYTFSTLSSREFENLARDLLQEEFGIRLETFTSGRDSGIDARWSDSQPNEIVVQCKHFVESGYRTLLRVLKREAKRIQNSNSKRYILVTSVGLTPVNKDEILQVLSPYCQTTADIFGRDDLNNLLGLYPLIEQRNFKLWLTSEAVLSKVVNAGVFLDADVTLDKARRKARRYVQNASYQRAINILEGQRYCVIAGLPGIGKTTLAEVILAHYVDQRGFQVCRIREDISEARNLRRPNVKQIFYYDDFLGTTTLESLRKNEDRRLIEFLDEVSENANWRFILTTREYILRAAQLRYEALSQASLDLTTCVVELEDYTDSVRAEILYNHLYFSDIPTGYKTALLEEQNYQRIYRHKNYNPRIIEHMTSALKVTGSTADSYVADFLANLDNPARIWQHAFERHLSRAARYMLLIMATLPAEVLLEDLRTAFWLFYQLRREKYGFEGNEADFRDALKMLDGNFIKVQRNYTQTIISFHNPSVQDFLEEHLSTNDEDVQDLIKSALFLEQYQILWTGSRRYTRGNRRAIGKARYSSIDSCSMEFVAGIKRSLNQYSCRLWKFTSHRNMTEFVRTTVSWEEKVSFVLNVTDALKILDGQNLATFVVTELKNNLRQHRAPNKKELINLLSRLKTIGIVSEEPDGEIYNLARDIIVNELDDIDDYKSLAHFVDTLPDDLSAQEFENIQSQFIDFCPEEVENLLYNDSNGVDWLQQGADDLREIADSLQVRLPSSIGRLEEAIQEMTEVEEDEVRPANKGGDVGHGILDTREINLMFEGLLRNLSEILEEE